MPLYSEEEYEALEKRLLRELNDSQEHWGDSYEKLLDVAEEAISALKPRRSRCSVRYDKFTGDWTPPERVRCENLAAMDGKCLRHLVEP